MKQTEEIPRRALKYRITITYDPPYNKFFSYSSMFNTLQEANDYKKVVEEEYGFEYHDGKDGHFKLEECDWNLDRVPRWVCTPVEYFIVENQWVKLKRG